MHFSKHYVAVLLALVSSACRSAPTPAAAGSDTARPATSSETTAADALEHNLALAREAFERDPTNELNTIWLGRRLGYVGRYEDAVEVFSRGLEQHPDSAWLLRFRGHRYLTLRRFDDAVRDLERAHMLAELCPDEVEPDGQPNKLERPIGTLRSNIDYHLGLAHFLRRDFERALTVYQAGLPLAHANDDRLASHTYWTVLTLWKLGRDAEARQLLASIRPAMDIIENDGYHALCRAFQGALSIDDALPDSLQPSTTEFASRAFGLAQLHLHNREPDRATALLRRVVEHGPKAAFGRIAAEVELKQLDERR